MNHRCNRVALGASTLVFALLIAGCGDYSASDDDDSAATGGAVATGGDGAGGTEQTGGTGAVGAQTGSGGSGAVAQASCDNVQPCGGDVVGTWTVASACVAFSGEINLASLGVGCTSAAITGSTLNVTGTWTAAGDGTYEDNLTWTGEQKFDLAPACLTVSGTTTTCDRMASSSLPSLGYIEGLIYDSVTCLPVDAASEPPPSGCNCTSAINQPGAASTGTYTIENNVITTSTGAEYAYCVNGNTLTLTPTKFALDASTTNTGTVVLTK